MILHSFCFDLHCVSLTCFYDLAFYHYCVYFLSGLSFQTKMDVEMDEPEPAAQNNEKVKLNLYWAAFCLVIAQHYITKILAIANFNE